MPSFQAISSPSFAKLRPRLQLLATDVDGTLTQAGQFTPPLLQALQDLRAAQISVVLVTGRSAGWVNGLVAYLPVAGAIAENGGLFFPKDSLTAVPLGEIADYSAADYSAHRAELAKLFAQLQQRWPQLQPSADNPYRLTDWTFDVAGLSQADLTDLAQACAAAGWGFTYSTVQCHLKPLTQTKATALTQVLADHFAGLTADQVLTVGDSPNDESLFERDRFPHSVGVANLKHYWEVLRHHPAYVTQNAEAQGFLELSQGLLEARSRRLHED